MVFVRSGRGAHWVSGLMLGVAFAHLIHGNPLWVVGISLAASIMFLTDLKDTTK